MTEFPGWPSTPPRHGSILLRQFTDDDAAFAMEAATDPYIPLISTLPAHADATEALAWVHRQHDRQPDGAGLPFVIADVASNAAVGSIGLWLRDLSAGRASVGYMIAPSQRRRGVARSALLAITEFAWTVPDVHRIELYIEPWNTGSVRTAQTCGYQREGLLRGYLEIGGERRDMLMYAAIRA